MFQPAIVVIHPMTFLDRVRIAGTSHRAGFRNHGRRARSAITRVAHGAAPDAWRSKMSWPALSSSGARTRDSVRSTRQYLGFRRRATDSADCRRSPLGASRTGCGNRGRSSGGGNRAHAGSARVGLGRRVGLSASPRAPASRRLRRATDQRRQRTQIVRPLWHGASRRPGQRIGWRRESADQPERVNAVLARSCGRGAAIRCCRPQLGGGLGKVALHRVRTAAPSATGLRLAGRRSDRCECVGNLADDRVSGEMGALIEPLVALSRFDVASEPFSGVGWEDPFVPVGDDPANMEASDGEACRSMAAERNQRPDRGEAHVPGVAVRSDAPVVLERSADDEVDDGLNDELRQPPGAPCR